MSTAARRRLMRDFKVCGSHLADSFPRLNWADLLQRMQTDPPAGVSASPVPDNVMTWYVDPSSGRPGHGIWDVVD